MNNQTIIILKKGGVGVLLTDTLYGIVGSALNQKTVKRIYNIKGRNNKKPFIILISSIEDLRIFGIKINDEFKKRLTDFWPGQVSIIVPCLTKKFKYLHRGEKTLAFRFPKKHTLIEMLKKTGPLVAPSANPENCLPASNIKEAKKYFGNTVDFYLKGGRPKSKPSAIIKMYKNSITIIRK